MSKNTIAINLPFPPSVNAYWRTVKGRMLISAAGREYRRAVAAAALEYRVSPGFQTGPVAVHVVATAPDRRRRDLDNLLKAALDSLNGIAWADDSQIEYLSIAWAAPRVAPPGGISVIVSRLFPQEREENGKPD